MLTVTEIDTTSKAQVRKFVRLPYRLYKNHPQWVPPLLIDSELYLNKEKHPFYAHSDAAFFIAEREGQVVGRIAGVENRSYNNYHETRKASFYFFDCEDNDEVAKALFQRVFEWCYRRQLDEIIGPKGFGPLDGYGILVEGYEHRQLMTMMNYNFPYYPRLVEAQGFTKEVDFVSCYLNSQKFGLPERVHRIAERVLQRGQLQVQRFQTKNDLRNWAKRIGQAYNQAFVNNWEYSPLTDKEIDFVLQNILTVADPRLIKIITHQDQAVGFLFGFPDLSAALQHAGGHLLPFGLVDIMLEMKRTKWVALNGAGILPEFQGRGGNALLYSEMEKTIRDFKFEHADLTQVAETAVEMRSDLINLGGQAYKNHRVYHRKL
jgi:hypothetical protein